MTSILVVYGTREGQTAKIAERVRRALVHRGHDVTTVRAGAVPIDEERFDAVLVGSPLNRQAHLPEVVAFVEDHREALSSRPSAFFQVSLAAAMPQRWARAGARRIAEDFFEATGWYPDRLGVFAGALAYSQYGRVERLLFRLAAMLTTGDTDPSRDYEYTDWAEVEAFARRFARDLESREGVGARVERLVKRVRG